MVYQPATIHRPFHQPLCPFLPTPPPAFVWVQPESAGLRQRVVPATERAKVLTLVCRGGVGGWCLVCLWLHSAFFHLLFQISPLLISLICLYII